MRRCIGAAFAEYEMRIDPARDRRAGRAQRPRPEAGEGQGPQHHPRPRPRAPWSGWIGRCADRRASACLPLLVELGDARAWPPRGARSARSARPGLDQAAGSASSSSTSRSSASARSIRSLQAAALRAAFCGRRRVALLAACRRLAARFAAAAVGRRFALRRARAGSSAQPLGWLLQLAVLADERAAADRLEQGAVVGDEDHRALEGRAARPRAPRGSRCRGGWWARRGSGRWRRRRPGSPARAAAARRRRCRSSCFSASAPEKRKPPSRSRAFWPLRPVSRWAASSTVPSPAAVSACWER